MGFYQPTHLSDVRATFCNKIGTQEPCLGRSPAWPLLKEQETKDRRSIIHRFQAAIVESPGGVSPPGAPKAVHDPLGGTPWHTGSVSHLRLPSRCSARLAPRMGLAKPRTHDCYCSRP